MRQLTRDFMALAAGVADEGGEEEEAGQGQAAAARRHPSRRPRLSLETLHLLKYFLRRELESWEGLPVPLS